MTELEYMLKKLDTYVTHNMCMYAKKSNHAYETQTPTYLLGKFECVYQFAYAIVEDDTNTIQDAIDFLNDDIVWYSETFKSQLTNHPFSHGYVDMAKAIVSFMRRLRMSYEFECEYPIKHVWSTVNMYNVFDAIK